MAKITVAGHTCIITSSVKMEDWNLVSKYAPEALSLRDEQTQEPKFAVGFAQYGEGSISKFGVEFATHSDVNGMAMIAMAVSQEVFAEGKVKEVIADKIGVALLDLEEVERKVETLLPDIKRRMETVAGRITIAG